ncbi:hypothetical protein SDC9_210647 [bioreactor metagenome]|uniref:Uncharacterized protein n=1 Tax=bioreactor metagenome TaxID=1076179 RepID=A0A645JRY0_9ZZZZ
MTPGLKGNLSRILKHLQGGLNRTRSDAQTYAQIAYIRKAGALLKLNQKIGDGNCGFALFC